MLSGPVWSRFLRRRTVFNPMPPNVKDNPRRQWARFIRSPAEQADLQVRAFPHDALDSLAREVRLETLDRLLNLGGSVGVLARHLAARMETGEVVLADCESEYLRAEVPASLHYRAEVRPQRVDYERLPFDSDRFDGVILADFLGFFPSGDRKEILEEVRRILTPGGRLIVLEPLEPVRWVPWGLELSEEEADRMERFESLRRKAHEAAGTRLHEPFDDLPRWLGKYDFSIRKTGGWFLPARLNDKRWTERQKTDLINLRHQARRDQVEVVRELLNAHELWENDHASLLRSAASDFQQQALRKRKALESDREVGWSGVPMLMVQATEASDES